jgi:hypothetical protein
MRDPDQLRCACVELLWAEWLGQKLRRSESHRQAVLLFLARGGEDDARERFPLRLGSDFGEHIEAAQVRHHEVEEDHLDVGLTPQDLECLTPVVRERDSERALLQLHLDDAADMRLIIRDQSVNGRHARVLVR